MLFKLCFRKQNTTNIKQIEILSIFMQEHTELAKGQLRTPNGREKSKHLWIKLTTSLNANGPPIKSITEWKKVNKFHYLVK